MEKKIRDDYLRRHKNKGGSTLVLLFFCLGKISSTFFDRRIARLVHPARLRANRHGGGELSCALLDTQYVIPSVRLLCTDRTAPPAAASSISRSVDDANGAGTINHRGCHATASRGASDRRLRPGKCNGGLGNTRAVRRQDFTTNKAIGRCRWPSNWP